MFGVGSYLNKQMKLTLRSKSKEEEESLHKGKMKKASKRQKKNEKAVSGSVDSLTSHTPNEPAVLGLHL